MKSSHLRNSSCLFQSQTLKEEEEVEEEERLQQKPQQEQKQQQQQQQQQRHPMLLTEFLIQRHCDNNNNNNINNNEEEEEEITSQPTPTITGGGGSGGLVVCDDTGQENSTVQSNGGVRYRTQYTKEEDDVIRMHVEKYGPRLWKKCKESLGGTRKPKQCRERWMNTLNPAINKSVWTPEEDAALAALYAQHGPRWTLIARELGTNRTDNCVKNHWNSRHRRGKRSSTTTTTTTTTTLPQTPQTPQTPQAGTPPEPKRMCMCASNERYVKTTTTTTTNATATAAVKQQKKQKCAATTNNVSVNVNDEIVATTSTTTDNTTSSNESGEVGVAQSEVDELLLFIEAAGRDRVRNKAFYEKAALEVQSSPARDQSGGSCDVETLDDCDDPDHCCWFPLNSF